MGDSICSVWKDSNSVEVDVALFSIIYGRGQSLARVPLNFTAPPAAVVIKVPGSFLWNDREGGALECGDSRHPATLASSPQALKTPRAVQQASCTFSRKGPKTGSWESVNAPSRLAASESSVRFRRPS